MPAAFSDLAAASCRIIACSCPARYFSLFLALRSASDVYKRQTPVCFRLLNENQTGVANYAEIYRHDLSCRHLPEIIEGRWRLFSIRRKESNSIANQRKQIKDYLKHHPEIILTHEFCDDGFTGANFVEVR